MAQRRFSSGRIQEDATEGRRNCHPGSDLDSPGIDRSLSQEPCHPTGRSDRHARPWRIEDGVFSGRAAVIRQRVSRQRKPLHPSGPLEPLIRRKGVPAVAAPVSVERSSAKLPRTPIRQSEGVELGTRTPIQSGHLGPAAQGFDGSVPWSPRKDA